MKFNSKYFKNLFSRILIAIILVLFVLILNKFNHNLTKEFKNNLFNKTFNFIKINRLTKKVFGKDVLYYQNNNESIEVLSNEYDLDSVEKYYDGEKFKVSSNLPIGAISSGVVVFIGNKENYGNTVIIQGVDGFNIWYSNIKDVNVSVYDYVEKQNLIGAADGEYVYLLIEKNNKYYSYDEYKTYKD